MVKGDLLDAQDSPSRTSVNNNSGDATLLGDAQEVPEKKKRRWGGMGPPRFRWGAGAYPTKLMLVRVIVTDAIGVEVSSIFFHRVLVSNRMLPAECPLRRKPLIGMARTPWEAGSIPSPLDWNPPVVALGVTVRSSWIGNPRQTWLV